MLPKTSKKRHNDFRVVVNHILNSFVMIKYANAAKNSLWCDLALSELSEILSVKKRQQKKTYQIELSSSKKVRYVIANF